MNLRGVHVCLAFGTRSKQPPHFTFCLLINDDDLQTKYMVFTSVTRIVLSGTVLMCVFIVCEVRFRIETKNVVVVVVYCCMWWSFCDTSLVLCAKGQDDQGEKLWAGCSFFDMIDEHDHAA
jgi:hypothetical protein